MEGFGAQKLAILSDLVRNNSLQLFRDLMTKETLGRMKLRAGNGRGRADDENDLLGEADPDGQVRLGMHQR
jgi:hypothetical protein